MDSRHTRHSLVDTVIGELTLVARDESLVGLYYPGHWFVPAPRRFGPEVPARTDPLLLDAATQVREYLSGERHDFDLPVATDGDDFQEAVWRLLRDIPRGETTSYGAIATSLGVPATARAVGQAVGSNPLCVIVPCHRVVGADGKMIGYAGGIARKRFLLELEAPAPALAGRLF